MGDSSKGKDAPATGVDDPDDDLGKGGKAALTKERRARRDAEQKVRDLEARIADIEKKPTKSKGKDDEDDSVVEDLKAQVTKLNEDLADERVMRLKAEVAAEKGLTPAQARRLSGTTKEELEDDADDLIEAFPAPPAKGDDEDDDPVVGKAKDRRPPARHPKERLKAGTGRDDEPVEETDVKKLGARMFES